MNHTNNINSLEHKVSSLLSDCLEVFVNQYNFTNHPIRVVESAKSLLGLDLNNPNKKLINFIDQISLKKDSHINNIDDYSSETVSIYQLKDAIEASDYSKCKNLVDNLVKLSDGKHILEFLLELSLLQTGKSTLMIWATYKSIKFINSQSNQSIKLAILMCCKVLILDDYAKKTSNKKKTIDDIYNYYNLQLNELHIIGTLFEISNADFIRSDKIKLNISQFLSFFHSTIDQSSKIQKDNLLENKIDKRIILDILTSDVISENLILSLNAIRACMKYSSSSSSICLQLYIDKVKKIVR